MKKFKEGDIFYNTIRCYPKVEFFANGGRVHYNKQNHPAITSRIPIESVGLFELLNPVPIELDDGTIPDNSLLAEDGDSLKTEGGDFILIES
jgi:hypothetical protein